MIKVKNMANIETLRTRVENTTKAIEKKENLIVKKEAQIEKKYKALEKLNIKDPKSKTKEDTYYLRETDRSLYIEAFGLYYDIESLQEDITKATKEIKEKKESLKKYEDQLNIEINKENAPKIQVLVDFLESWKEEARAFYLKERLYDNEEDLERFLQREVKAKYEDLVNRISKVTGEIKDCKNLYIASNGCINGFVIGEKAKAEVETILAGGYNIQCLHYRVLVKKIK